MRIRRQGTVGVVRRAATVALAVLLGAPLGSLAAASASPDAPVPSAASAPAGPVARVIVTSTDGTDPGPVVVANGGTVVRTMPALGAVVADVHGAARAAIARSVRIRSVTPDRSVRLAGADKPDKESKDKAEKKSKDDVGSGTSMSDVDEVIGATDVWRAGARGAGVDVALIDSGVSSSAALKGRVVDGPDLSFDSQVGEGSDSRDGFGHGTHMAGIIAGDGKGKDGIAGVAPAARLVNVKVADANGAVDVSQIIAAIDWVVTNRRSGGLDIRVLNLSFGTESDQSYVVDPLSFAAEAAWRQGIVVVTSVGNTGRTGLTDPAYNPHVLAVGAADTGGTIDGGDDQVAPFSSRGDGERNPDLVAPGVSLASLRAPGSTIDTAFPEARLEGGLFKGTGTSQSTAVVAGAAALLLSARPALTPDQVKAALVRGARAMADGPRAVGAGMIDVAAALAAADRPELMAPDAVRQPFAAATGRGTLEAARGGVHLVDGRTGAVLSGEVDIFGQPFDSIRWSALAGRGQAWDGGVWNGVRWAGDGWSAGGWTGVRWSSVRWTSANWAGTDWQSVRWNGVRWSSVRWTGEGWDGVRWASVRWQSVRWQ